MCLYSVVTPGGSVVILSPMDFLRNPALWIVAFFRYKGGLSAGPDFAFRLVVRKWPQFLQDHPKLAENIDLSSLHTLMACADPQHRHCSMIASVNMD
jgi:acyl-CoA synthetase (AMP-forming)/AMP-acid ligase II